MKLKFSFKDISVRTKLAAVVLIPVLSMLAFVSMNIFDNYQNIKTFNQIASGVDFSTKAGALVHELQKERGASVLYVSENGQTGESLNKQFEETNKSITEFNAAAAKIDASTIGAAAWEEVEAARKLLNTMVNKRSDVTNLKVTTAEILEYATAVIDGFLHAEAHIAHLSDDQEIAMVAEAYTKLVDAKEKAGLTRAAGAAGFGPGQFTNESFLRFATKVAETNVLLSELLKTASPSQAEVFHKRMKSKEALEANKIIVSALQLGPNALLPITGNEWFAMATNKVNLLKEVEDIYANELKQVAQEHKTAATIAGALSATSTLILTLITIVLGVTVYRGLMSSVNNLSETVGDIAKGKYDTRAKVLGGDEMGILAMALNQMLDDRVQSLAKAEKENETLNNSVVDLLKAVFVLSQRDLTTRCEVDQTVIGTVADSINQLTTETAKVLGEVTNAANRVGRASEKVKSQASSVSMVAENELQSVSTMTEGIGKTVEQVSAMAELASNTNKSAEEATASTNEALDRVSDTVKGMEAIRENIAETEKRIKRLGERSQEISGIVNLINTISERTHVLALNASMQAAIAGEAGRGFAVVAEEVQRLAESSRNATSQIAALVNNIQIETSDTVATVNKTISQVVSESELARKAGTQMEKTQRITAQLAEMVQKIAASAQIQAQSAQLLRKQVEQIGAGALQTREQIAAQNEETQLLESTAQQLLNTISVFKLPQEVIDSANDTQSITGSLPQAA